MFLLHRSGLLAPNMAAVWAGTYLSLNISVFLTYLDFISSSLSLRYSPYFSLRFFSYSSYSLRALFIPLIPRIAPMVAEVVAVTIPMYMKIPLLTPESLEATTMKVHPTIIGSAITRASPRAPRIPVLRTSSLGWGGSSILTGSLSIWLSLLGALLKTVKSLFLLTLRSGISSSLAGTRILSSTLTPLSNTLIANLFPRKTIRRPKISMQSPKASLSLPISRLLLRKVPLALSLSDRMTSPLLTKIAA